jgi:CDI immunity proteins
MIGQNIGLKYLVPLALEHLRKDPLAKRDFYPGGLLKMVLTADPNFWRDHPQWRKEIDEIAQRAHAA